MNHRYTSKLPKKETKLEKDIKEFNALTVDLPSDSSHAKSWEHPWKDARDLMKVIRDECLRVHAKNLWEVSEIRSALQNKVREFWVAALEQNLKECLEFLEMHTQNKVTIVREEEAEEIFTNNSSRQETKEREITVAKYDESYKSVYFYEWRFSKLTSYYVLRLDDGIRYPVRFVRDTPYDRTRFYASDASLEEMGNPRYPKETGQNKLDLKQYLDVCLTKGKRIHRKDTLFQVIFDTLESHILQIKDRLKAIDDWDSGHVTEFDFKTHLIPLTHVPF